jgi:hypothetical protein
MISFEEMAFGYITIADFMFTMLDIDLVLEMIFGC